MTAKIESTTKFDILDRGQTKTGHVSTPVILADICIFLVVALSTGSWWQLSRMRFIAVIALVGLFSLWMQKKPTSREIVLNLAFIVCHSSVLIATTLYGTVSELVYHFGLAFCVFPFLQAYIIRFGVRNAIVYPFILSAVPHLFPQFFGDSANRLDIRSSIEAQIRFIGSTGDPNYTALGLAAPFAASLFLCYSKGLFNRLFWSSISFAIAISIITTGSRAGLGAVVCVFLLFVLALGKQIKRVLPYLLVASVFTVAFYSAMGEYIDFFYRRTGGTLAGYFEDSRYLVWLGALDIILKSPVINSVSQDVFMGYYYIVVHNFLLDIGLTYGSLTMGIHVIVLITGILMLVYRYRASSKVHVVPEKNVFVLTGLVCTSVLICISTLTAGTSTIYWFIYSLLWAVCFSPSSTWLERATNQFLQRHGG